MQKHSRAKTCPECEDLLSSLVRLDEHLAKLLQLLWPSDFFREKRKLDDVEKFVVKFVCLVEILLLHRVSDAAVFAI